MMTKSDRKKIIELYRSCAPANIEIAKYLLKGLELSPEDMREMEVLHRLSTRGSLLPNNAVLIHGQMQRRRKGHQISLKQKIKLGITYTLEGTRLIVSGKSKKIAFYCGRSKPSIIVDVSNENL